MEGTPARPHDPSPRFALAYPIAFFGGAFLLCAALLHGKAILSFTQHVAEVLVEEEEAPSAQGAGRSGNGTSTPSTGLDDSSRNQGSP